MLPLDGCLYVTGIGHKGNDAFKIFCHKLVEPGSLYCPLHNLLVEDEYLDVGRLKKKRKEKMEQKKTEMEALALSPLRAENFDFDKEDKGTGYEK